MHKFFSLLTENILYKFVEKHVFAILLTLSIAVSVGLPIGLQMYFEGLEREIESEYAHIFEDNYSNKTINFIDCKRYFSEYRCEINFTDNTYRKFLCKKYTTGNACIELTGERK